MVEEKSTEITVNLTPEAISQLLSLSNDFQIPPAKVVEKALNFVSFYREFFKEGLDPATNPIKQIKQNIIENNQKQLKMQTGTLNEIEQLREKTKQLYQQMIQQQQEELELKQGKLADEKRKREREVQRQRDQLERLIRKGKLDNQRDEKTIQQAQKRLSELTQSLNNISTEIDQQLKQYHSKIQEQLPADLEQKKTDIEDKKGTKGEKFGKIKVF